MEPTNELLSGRFDRYVQHVMRVLIEASQTKFDHAPDLAAIDFANALRLSILDTYSGIIAGLAEDNKLSEFQMFTSHVVGFLELIANDPDRERGVLASAIGLIGDLVQNLKDAMRHLVDAPCISALLNQGLASGDQSLIDNAQWANNLVRQLRGR